jgi:hypothetical protein
MDKRCDFKTGYLKIREVLMREWDPIGVRDVPQAQDEYDSYIPKLFAMIVERQASAEDIGRHLLDIVTSNMGLSGGRFGQENCRRVAEALVKLRPTLIE